MSRPPAAIRDVQGPSNRKLRKQAERQEQQALRAARRRRRALVIAVASLAVVAVVTAFLAQRGASSDETQAIGRPNVADAGLAWSRDGALLALNERAGDGEVLLWDVQGGSAVRTISAGGQQGAALAWARGGDYLAVARSYDPKAKRTPPAPIALWRTAGWRQAPVPAALAATLDGPVQALAFSPDGSRLAVQTASRLTLLGVPALRPLAAALNALPVNAPRPILRWSADGTRLVVGLTDGGRFNTVGVGVLDGRSLRNQRTLILAAAAPGSFIGAASPAPRGTELAVGGASGAVAVFDMASGKALRSLGRALNSVTALDWSPDGTRLAMGGLAAAAILDARDATVVARRAMDVDLEGSKAVQNTVEALAWSPDGARLAISGNNARTRIWTPPATPR